MQISYGLTLNSSNVILTGCQLIARGGRVSCVNIPRDVKHDTNPFVNDSQQAWSN